MKGASVTDSTKTQDPKLPPIVVIGAQDIEAAIIRRQLDGVAEIVAVVTEAAAAAQAIHQRHPHVAILFMDHQRDDIVAVGRALAAEGVTTIMVSRDRDPDTILLAMRSGARDFAYLEGEENDVRRAVLALPTIAGTAVPRHEGMVIAVFGCKGGSGATTIATNLAGALLEADSHRKVVIVDADAQLGDVLTFLDLPVRYTWAELLANLTRLDDELVHRSLTTHATGLQVVAQGGEPEDADVIDPGAVAQTIAFLRQHYDCVIVDGLRDFRETSLAALDAADRVLVTLTQDVPALKNASRCLAVFRRLGYRADKLKLVINRYHKRTRLDLDTIAEALGGPIDATIANDFPTVMRSIDEGALLVKAAPGAHVTDDLRGLVRLLGLAPREVKRHWFGRAR